MVDPERLHRNEQQAAQRANKRQGGRRRTYGEEVLGTKKGGEVGGKKEGPRDIRSSSMHSRMKLLQHEVLT